MKNTTTDLPSKLQPLASLLDAQPPEVQEAFQFLLATAMPEAGKFELVGVAEVQYTSPNPTPSSPCLLDSLQVVGRQDV